MSVMDSISSQTCQPAFARRIATTKASDAKLPTTSQLPTAAIAVTMRERNLQMWTALLRTRNKIRKNRHMMAIGLVCLYVRFEVATMCC